MTTRDSEVDSVLRAVSAAPPAEPPQETPQLGDRYALKKEIGRGGMGRVFLAQDRRLGRDVAIKLLATGAPGGERLLRFEQEARAVASLSHPNIITVFDVGVSAGAPYIVSELLRGGTLREKLSGTTLQPKEALDYAGQLAQGLVAAHEKGIVHRDLKPDNLFITEEGRLKILDFGIAKLLAPLAETERTATLTPDLASRAASPTPTERFIAELAPASPEAPTPQSLGADDTPRTPRTATGTVLGTVGYMSPEQVRGEPADPRSDLFAFGAIVYEMLAGQRAFKRGNQQATDYAILHDEPPGLPASVPKALGRLVQRCLKKDPAGRFQSARELAAELAQLRLGWSRAWKLGALVGAVLLVALAAVALLQPVPAARAGRLTLAAADFVNDTKEEELDGLSGMLITSLEQSKRLSVLTRGRMFDILKGLGRGDAARIDEKLGREISAEASADVLALGSIRRFGALYSIDLKLIDPVKNVLLFAASERGTGRESIPGMLDRLSERTRAALQEKEEDIRAANVGVAHSTTANLEAYQHYFLAEELRARGREVQAIAELRLAIQADPRFALAHFSLGASFEFLGVRDLASELAEFETALRLGLPPREKCWAQAEITVAHDRSPRALELIDSCVERFPNDKRLLFVAASWVLYDLARKERIGHYGRQLGTCLLPLLECLHQLGD